MQEKQDVTIEDVSKVTEMMEEKVGISWKYILYCNFFDILYCAYWWKITS